MFSDIWSKIKELTRGMLPKKSVEEVLQVSPMISDKMMDAIQLWSDMYEGNSPWLREPTYDDPVRIVSLGLPALIASEKARMAVLEMKSEISAPTEVVDLTAEAPAETSNLNSAERNAIGNNAEVVSPATGISSSSAFMPTTELRPIGPTERADFLNKQYKKVLKQIRRQLEYGIAKGGLIIKPYIVIYNTANKSSSETFSTTSESTTGSASTANAGTNKTTLRYNKDLDSAEIEFDFIQADRFFPLAFDANGKVIEAAFVQTKVNKAKERVYIRLEYHKLEKRRVTVRNFAFESTDMSLATSNNLKSATNLGTSIPLSAVPEWASLQETTVIEDVDRLLFAYFRMPEANTVDPYSPLGVSGYSRVIQLIRDADMQYSRLLWEFEAGEMAIDVDRDALKFVTEGDGTKHSVNPEKQQRLFRKVDLNTEDTYNVFAPGLRDASIVHGLNTIFQRIEDVCGISRGTISEITNYYTQEAKTATELKIIKQRSYATNADIQVALQDALEDLVYVMDVYCTLYEVTPDGEYEVSFEWDDSIIVDSESELSKRITLMQNGLASKLETRMWYFGETENQAKTALQQVDKEAVQAMIQNAQAASMQTALATTEEAENEGATDQSTTSPADRTSAKRSSGQQADSLDTPSKTVSSRALRTE